MFETRLATAETIEAYERWITSELNAECTKD